MKTLLKTLSSLCAVWMCGIWPMSLGAGLVITVGGSVANAAQARPNIVYIMDDELGY